MTYKEIREQMIMNLRLDFDQPELPQPHSVLAEATVMDVNRQAWAGSTSLVSLATSAIWASSIVSSPEPCRRRSRRRPRTHPGR